MTWRGWTAASIAALVLLAGVVFGGWELGWWFRTQNVNRTTHLQRHSLQWQQSYETAVQQGITTVTQIDAQLADPSLTDGQRSGLRGERAAVLAQTCDQAALIDPSYVTPDVTAFATSNCH